jgi:hypothetical protein
MKTEIFEGKVRMDTRLIDPTDDDFGAVLNCAVRYSLGRRSYMPGLVIGFITPLIPHISDRTLDVMIRDIRNPYGGYGDPQIDEPGWMRFLGELTEEQKRRKEADCHTSLRTGSQ